MTTPVRDLPSRYGLVAMTLHWVIAAAIIANLALALIADDLPRAERMAMMWWHKSIGLAVLVLSVARVAWRWVNPVPPPPPGLKPIQRISGTALHHLFYMMIVLIPLAGWLMVSLFSPGTSFFGLFDWPAFPGLYGMTREAAHPYHEVFETVHIWLGWALIGLIPLHVAAGLYHHLILKDNVLLRMLPGTRLRPGV